MSSVDVVIPTHNRASLLAETLPSYCQQHVSNVYVVDDFSTDNTSEVVADLSRMFPQITYLKARHRGRQMGAKNLGLAHSTSDYIYFGDDDSIIIPGTIQSLLEIVRKHPKNIIGARHIYMSEGDLLAEIPATSYRTVADPCDIYDPSTMKLDLRYTVPSGTVLPFCQACFLVDGQMARSLQYDERFFGTCFREETDYILGIRKKGYGLIICNDALQINLPRSRARIGGTSSVRPIFRHISEIMNEYYFFQKHGDFLKNYVEFSTIPIIRATKLLLSKVYAINKFI